MSHLEMLGNVTSGLLKRQLEVNSRGKKSKTKYSEELKRFALTLHFYSPRAYKYVRKTFHTCLPHPRTITKWYQCVDGQPGFTKEALAVLKNKVVSIQKTGHSVYCCLIIDEMAIRQHVEWDGKKSHGYVDYGCGHDNSDSLPVAKNVLACMLVCINGSWKLPVGYFFVNGVGSEQQKNIVNECLSLVHETGAHVVSLTFDGAAQNISMAKQLGCSLDVGNLKTSFPHPITELPVYVIFDPSHMLKLVRNTLGDKACLMDPSGNKISWKYIEELHKLQKKEGLHLANKLHSVHMQWRSMKMKVKLAAQVLSQSVASALQICLDKNIPGFEDCSATIEFISNVNKLFDILNSNSIMQKGCKKALYAGNVDDAKEFLGEMKVYFASLTIPEEGKSLLTSTRKTGFIGFSICISSILNLYDELIASHKLTYLPTYKMSQDHLEMFFSSIRSQGGCNNNPTAKQFTAAYKKVLVNSEIMCVSQGSNCTPLENIKILQASSWNHKDSATVINETCDRPEDTDIARVLDDDNCIENELIDHSYVQNATTLSNFSHYVVAYIAGFTVRKLQKILKCEICVDALQGEDSRNEAFALIRQKDRGALIYPSQDVMNVCKLCEKLFRHLNQLGLGHIKFSPAYIINKVLKHCVGKQFFQSLTEHCLNQSPLDNHCNHLIRCIAQQYLHVRYAHFAKNVTEGIYFSKLRQKYNKLILFSGQ